MEYRAVYSLKENIYLAMNDEDDDENIRFKLGEKGEKTRVEVDGDEQMIRELFYLLITRAGADDQLSFVKKHRAKAAFAGDRERERNDVADLLLTLSYIVEYCRATRRSKLLLVDARNHVHTALLDLSLLVVEAKFCVRCGLLPSQAASSLAAIQCASCHVAAWCSEQCLASDFECHSDACDRVQQIKSRLGI
jgi:hypothetical protein